MCRSASARTMIRCLRPNGRLISISSPTRSSRFGFAGWRFTSSLPPLQAFCASERVLKRHATSSQTSRRTPDRSSLTISAGDSTVCVRGGLMRMRTGLVVIFVALSCAFLTLLRPHAADGPYQKIKEIPIPGEGGWDYLNVDAAARRLYVSHASRVVVIDLAKDEIVGEIADTPGVHGAIPAGADRVFTSNGRGNTASVVDAK